MNIGDNEETHPSFGMIRLSKLTGGEMQLHGSSIPHNGCISLQICHGSVDRHLSRDWYHSNGRIVELRMSPTQWAELISMGMNMGDGSPCTLHWTKEDGMIPSNPIPNKRQQFEDEFKTDMKRVGKVADDMSTRLNELRNKKGPVSKKEIDELLWMTTKFKQDVESNIPFVHTQFQEQMDATSLEAKGEVEHFYNTKITALGIDKLKEELGVPSINNMTDAEEAEEAQRRR